MTGSRDCGGRSTIEVPLFSSANAARSAVTSTQAQTDQRPGGSGALVVDGAGAVGQPQRAVDLAWLYRRVAEQRAIVAAGYGLGDRAAGVAVHRLLIDQC